MYFDNAVLQQLKTSRKNNKESKEIKEIKEGIVRANDKGFGFLEVDNKESFFIIPNNMKKLLSGDMIEAEIIVQNGRTQAVPLKLITPALTRFVGRVTYVNNKLYITPDIPTIKFDIRAKSALKTKGQRLASGDWVVAHLSEHAMNNGEHIADITEVITTAKDPKIPWLVSLAALELPHEPPCSAEPFTYHDEELPHTDLTALPFVTIDSAKTKDMDDALCIEPNGDGWKLLVAIADPTGYITEDNQLDQAAAKRAFSIYLPGKDIPMLPRELSDDLCSLKEGEVRNTLVGTIFINSDGSIADEAKFELAQIKSQGKLIYDKVSDLLEGQATDFAPNEVVLQQIKMLEQFCLARSDYRSKHANIFKEHPEYEFVLDDNGALQEIKLVTRRIANRIVEEAMIVANTCAGKFLAQHYNTGIFNSHLGFDEEKLNDVIDLLKTYNCPYLDPNKIKTMEGFNELKRWTNQLDDEYLDLRLRKLQAYALITTQPMPHYGLGLDYYATWTSPIRKYGDMINHRLIKAYLAKLQHPKMPNDDTIESMNQAKKINRIAERKVRDWLYVDYLFPAMKAKTVFEGQIIDIGRGGLRITLLENGAMGFMPCSFMCEDRKAIDNDVNNGIIKVHGIEQYRLGQTIKVTIQDINAQTRSIVLKEAQ